LHHALDPPMRLGVVWVRNQSKYFPTLKTMKTVKIALLSIFAFGFVPNIPLGDALALEAEAKPATRYKTIYGTGKTETEAYANARSKIPSGWTEKKADLKKISSNPVKWQCTLHLKK
jgi:hypothetical protein